MLINSAHKMLSIERRISIEFKNPAHQLSANILGRYLWMYLYVSRLIHIHDGFTREELFAQIWQASIDSILMELHEKCWTIFKSFI